MTINEKKKVGLDLYNELNVLCKNWSNKPLRESIISRLKGCTSSLSYEGASTARAYATCFKYQGFYEDQLVAPTGQALEVLEAYGLC